ncbi:cell envelope integrity protein CreD [Bacteroidales bacterium OttesenSCG-928-M11]|nr:cell envelope integrity protein CreD [Bacteroidales bacterium OttesenSCG-928-M11]
MKTTNKSGDFTQSITFKGFIIAFLMLILLIPQGMILGLIKERKQRSAKTIEKINEKWGSDQVIAGPILSIPYTEKKTNIEMLKSSDEKYKKQETITYEDHELNITPDELTIRVDLHPEEKYYGIYKAILYQSIISMKGNFNKINTENYKDCDFKWEEAYITIGLSDLKGIGNQIDFKVGEERIIAEANNVCNGCSDKQLVIALSNIKELNEDVLFFESELNLNGSGSLNFIPMGKSTQVEIVGNWGTPNFTGGFSPESVVEKDYFSAKWSVLNFNRNIPDTWIDTNTIDIEETSFGVNLIEPVNHYQQNERAAKYAFIFIALTFVVFIFVELLTKKQIHPVQYLLIGIALILFYSLLLSLSEQINFSIAYLISSIVTIGLISVYAQSIFKDKKQTGILSSLLILSYLFFYIILQQEDFALLMGSVGLFIILGIIMFVSKKIDFYKRDELND